MINKTLLILVFIFSLISVKPVNSQIKLTDFETGGEQSSKPLEIVKFGKKIIFPAESSVGRELWISDGTESNTTLLKDILPGSGDGIPFNFSENHCFLNDKIFFATNRQQNSQEIWMSDGTTEGTKMIKGFIDAQLRGLANVGEEVYFILEKESTMEVWKTTGNEVDTKAVKVGLNHGRVLVHRETINNLFFFTLVETQSRSAALWRSDGTDEGTFVVSDSFLHYDEHFTDHIDANSRIVYKNELYFIGVSNTLFSEPNTLGLLKTDGTQTVGVKSIKTLDTDFEFVVSDAIIVDEKIYFFTLEWIKLGRESKWSVWETDGTENGSLLLAENTENLDKMIPSLFFRHDQDVFFTTQKRNDDFTIQRLSTSTGKVEEITFFRDDVGSSISKFPLYFHRHVKFFIAADNRIIIRIPTLPDFSTSENWEWNTATNNLSKIDELKNLQNILEINDRFIFQYDSDSLGREIGFFTAENTTPRMLKNINAKKIGVSTQSFTSTALVQNKFFLSLNSNEHGREVHVYDHDEKRLSLVADIFPGTRSSNPFLFNVGQDKLYFRALENDFGFSRVKEVLASDLSIRDIGTAANGYKQDRIGVFKDNLILSVKDLITGEYKIAKAVDDSLEFLWSSIEDSPDIGNIEDVLGARDHVFFTEFRALWKTDGSTEGTIRLTELDGGISPVNRKVIDNKLFYQQGGRKNSLLVSDGTVSGTKMVKELESNMSINLEKAVYSNEKLVFHTFSEGKWYLWVTDGTSEGTRQLTDQELIIIGSFTEPAYAILDDKIYFASANEEDGTELWVTDGTPDGTMMLKDINQGENGSNPSHFVTINDRVYCSAFTEELGSEIWTTDGTSRGTYYLVDVLPGQESSNPRNFMEINGDLVFIAEDELTTGQLWQADWEREIILDAQKVEDQTVLYPNPTDDNLSLSATKINNAKVYDLNGSLIPVIQTGQTLNTAELKAGTYILVYEKNGDTHHHVFVKR